MPTIKSALTLAWSHADRQSKRHLAVTLLVVLASSAVVGLAPLLLKQLVDRLEQKSAGASTIIPLVLVVAYVLAYGLSRTLSELRTMYFGFVDQRLQKRLSDGLLRHVMALPASFHMNRKTGALCQTLANGLLGYRLLLHHLMVTLLPLLVELGTMCTVLVALDRVVFLVILCGSIVLYTLVFWIGTSRVAKPARAASTANIEANSVLTDSILNYETVKLFGGEETVRTRFVEAASQCEGEWIDLLRKKMENGLSVATVFVLSFGISVYLAANEVRAGEMTIGGFTLINAYLLQMIRPVETLGFAVRDLAQGAAYLEKLIEVFSVDREAERGDHCRALCTIPPELAFDRVCYAYPGDRRALVDVSLVVPPGRMIALVGATGSGKSSLIRLLLRFMEPTAGQISMNGVRLPEISLTALRSAIAVVPQDTALFDDSIAYNIGFGKPDHSEADIVGAARIAHLHEFISDLPDGYETKVGERGVRLSGGERQRIAIARAAIRNPAVLIFDEATSSLDSMTERAVLRDLSQLTKTATTLIVAHRLSTVVQADEIVVLDHGMIVERGSHAKLLSFGGYYAAMWYEQQGALRSPRACPSSVS